MVVARTQNRRRISIEYLMNTASLLWSMVFSTIGFSYFIYGKKQKHSVALYAGIGLMLFSFFIENLWLTLAVGSALMSLPFVFKE